MTNTRPAKDTIKTHLIYLGKIPCGARSGFYLHPRTSKDPGNVTCQKCLETIDNGLMNRGKTKCRMCGVTETRQWYFEKSDHPLCANCYRRELKNGERPSRKPKIYTGMWEA